MGYPTASLFDIKFIERTKQNLKEFKGDNNFTNLVNNLIGLIFIPHEYNDKGIRKELKFMKRKISEVDALAEIFVSRNIDVLVDGKLLTFPKFKFKREGKELNINEIEIKDILRVVRNSFAHANLIPFGEGNIWQGIIIKNFQDKKKERKDKYNFIAVFNREELEKFAITVSDFYLEERK